MTDRKAEEKFIDPTLVYAAQKEDPEATERLYIELRGRTQRYFLGVSSDKAVAEDLADITTSTILTKIGKYSPMPGRRFESWAGVVTRNKWRDYLRHQDAKRRAEARYLQRIRTEEAVGVSHEGVKLQEQQRELFLAVLHNPLSKITFGQRAVLELRASGREFSEIAKLMGKSRDAVKKLAERGKRKIRKQILRESIIKDTEPPKAKPERARRFKKLEAMESLLRDRHFREWLLLTGIASCKNPQLLESQDTNGRMLKKAGWKSSLNFSELSCLYVIPQHADVFGISFKELMSAIEKTERVARMRVSRLESKLPPCVTIEREYPAGVMHMMRITDPEKM